MAEPDLHKNPNSSSDEEHEFFQPGKRDRSTLVSALAVAEAAHLGRKALEADIKRKLQLAEHNITELAVSRHGNILHFLLAWAGNESTLYVGIHVEKACKDEVWVGVGGLDDPAAKVLPTIWKAASLFPRTLTAAKARNATSLVLSGWGDGGAVAALLTSQFHEDEDSTFDKSIRCYAFQTPCFHNQAFCKHFDSIKEHLFYVFPSGWRPEPRECSYPVGQYLKVQKLTITRTSTYGSSGSEGTEGSLRHILLPKQQQSPADIRDIRAELMPKISSIDELRCLSSNSECSTENSAEDALLLIQLKGENLEGLILEQTCLRLSTFSDGKAASAASVSLPNESIVLGFSVSKGQLDSFSGCELRVVTAFGFSKWFEIGKPKIHHDTIVPEDAPSKVFTKALQMSLVLGPGSSDGSELLNIVQQIVKLLPGAKDVSFEGADAEILATEAQYHSYKDLTDEMRKFLSTPIKGFKRVQKKLVALIIAGVFVYLTGIALLFLAPPAGAAVIASGFIFQGTIIASTAMAVGTAMTLSLIPLQRMFFRNYDTLTMIEVSSYTEFITIICRSLQRQVQKSRAAELLQSSSIVDLQKALCILWEATKASNHSKDPKESFKDTPFVDLNLEEKEELCNRIEVACHIHKLRAKVRQHCFIGFIGPQNVGKSTLLNQLYNDVHQKTGYEIHTERPRFLKQGNVYVTDYPGVNAMAAHAKCFSICGLLNSFVVVMARFDGDVSADIINYLDQVYAALEGTHGNTEILLCVNKCGFELPNTIEEILQRTHPTEGPIEHLKKSYARQLTEHWEEKKKWHSIKPENILFTDLKASEEHRRLGIVGAEAVRDKIDHYLRKRELQPK